MTATTARTPETERERQRERGEKSRGEKRRREREREERKKGEQLKDANTERQCAEKGGESHRACNVASADLKAVATAYETI